MNTIDYVRAALHPPTVKTIMVSGHEVVVLQYPYTNPTYRPPAKRK